MSVRGPAAALGALLATAAPAAAQQRTGPQATPPAVPAYAQPAPSLTPAAPTGRVAAPADATPITEVRIAAEGPHGDARPPKGWQPAREAGADLRLDHQPGEALDEAWARRQFQLNGLPGPGGVGRALALVQVINRAYLSAGFINSGVVVRPSPAPGVLDLRVVYGGLAPPMEGSPAISVQWLGGGDRGLNDAYVRDRMPAAGRRPLNAADLERDFRLLAEDPAIRTINADLRPGSRPGEASLGLAVYPQDRFDLYVTAANNRSPAVGGERLAVGGSIRNLLGAGDILSGEAGITDGVEDLTLAWSLPFLSPKNTLTFQGAINDAAIIDPLLAPLDISARDKALEGSLTRKVIDVPLLPSRVAGRWSSAQTLTLGGGVAWRESKAYLFDEPFSFAPGAVGGRTEYVALRFIADYVVRNVDQVFAVSVTATQGLDGTRSDLAELNLPTGFAAVPQKDFRAVLAQVNYARRLSARGLELRVRVYGQWSNGVLYSGERLSAGGEATVRGYRENLVLADHGAIGSLELAQPFSLSGRQGVAQAFDWGAFTASVFADGAYMRNDKAPQPQKTIYSVGGSLTWTPSDAFFARITYGEQLKDVEPAGKRNLQDRGVSFRATVRPLLILQGL